MTTEKQSTADSIASQATAASRYIWQGSCDFHNRIATGEATDAEHLRLVNSIAREYGIPLAEAYAVHETLQHRHDTDMAEMCAELGVEPY